MIYLNANGRMGFIKLQLSSFFWAGFGFSMNEADKKLTYADRMFSLPAEMIINNAVKRHKVIPFSRIPIYDGSEENIIGVVLIIKMLIVYQEGREDDKLQTLIQSVHKIDEEVDVAQLLKEFFLRRQHLFVVTKKNQVVGIVTLEDAIESLLGVEIVDETDAVVDMRELAARIKQKNNK